MKKFPILLLLLPLLSMAQPDSTWVVTSDHVKLFSKTSGHGPVCIFIHGGPGAWSRSFEEMGGRNLETKLTMVYFDQRGCGRSTDAPDGDYSLNRMVEDIECVRNSSGATRVFIAAHSFGGILATAYALRYPEHVSGLILANCTLNVPYSIDKQITYMNSLLAHPVVFSKGEYVIDAFKRTQQAFNAEGLSYKMLSDNAAHVDLLNRIDAGNPSDYGFGKIALSMKEYLQDFTPETKKIQVPVLIITGSRDHAIGEKHYQDFAFPHQKVEKIAGGHLLYFENNQKFTAAIFEFVAGCERRK